MSSVSSLKFENGDLLPILGLGTWKAEPGEVGEVIKTAIRMGYRHIDCASLYGNEAEIGQALNELLEQGEIKREELWVTSKLWNDCHHPDHVRPAMEKTLADLQLDYLDLYLMHWPLAFEHGQLYPETVDALIPLAQLPLETTWKAMGSLLDDQLCRHLGVANFSIKKLQRLIDQGTHRPEVNQIEMHPYLQQRSMVEFCQRERILLTAYAPLGSGGRPETLKEADEPTLLADPVIAKIAQAHQVTPAQILLRWGMARGTAVIPKTVQPTRLKENLAALNIQLDQAEIAAIDQLDQHRRYFRGSFWNYPEKGYTLANLWDE